MSWTTINKKIMRLISDSRQTWLRWLPAIFFAIAIFVFSSIPGKKVGDSVKRLNAVVITIPSERTQIPVFPPQIDWLKVGHVIGYFCLGFSILYALTTYPRWSPLSALVICSLYALTDEFHQGFVPERSAEGRDVLLDGLASLVGILIMLGVVKWRDRGKSGEARTSSR